MMSVCLPDVEYSHPPEEGSLPPIDRWLHTLHPKGRETKISQETRINSQSIRTCSPNEKGGQLDNPQGVTQFTGLNRPQN